MTPSPAPKNIFSILSENSFNCLYIAKKIKKMRNFYTMVTVNYRKKYIKYISVYIKVKIVEISKYNLSYMRYYIVKAIRGLIIIF